LSKRCWQIMLIRTTSKGRSWITHLHFLFLNIWTISIDKRKRNTEPEDITSRAQFQRPLEPLSHCCMVLWCYHRWLAGWKNIWSGRTERFNIHFQILTICACQREKKSICIFLSLYIYILNLAYHHDHAIMHLSSDLTSNCKLEQWQEYKF